MKELGEFWKINVAQANGIKSFYSVRIIDEDQTHVTVKDVKGDVFILAKCDLRSCRVIDETEYNDMIAEEVAKGRRR